MSTKTESGPCWHADDTGTTAGCCGNGSTSRRRNTPESAAEATRTSLSRVSDCCGSRAASGG